MANLKQQKQLDSEQVQKVDSNIHHKLNITKIQEKQMIWSLQQSANGKLIISVYDGSLNIRSSGNLKLLMKRNFKIHIFDSCFNENFKLFAFTNHGNLYIYQNFVNLIYHKDFELQQFVRFISNDHLLFWSDKYLIKMNVINQNIEFKMTLNKKFPIIDLDYNFEKELILIGSNNIKIRSLINGLILLESQPIKDDQIQYIKFQPNNTIITKHKDNKIKIWQFDQDKIEQVQIINPIIQQNIIYASIIKNDYILTIQYIQRIQEKLMKLMIVIYNKSGNIIHVRKLERNQQILMTLLLGQFVNRQINNGKYLNVQTYGIILNLMFQTPVIKYYQRYEILLMSPIIFFIDQIYIQILQKILLIIK
ncbi:hypothetical protein pb186bvf_012837 [Paramecium bursaria]